MSNRTRSGRVAIFGAGMGGLSCAHELTKHGFSIDVYEASDSVGGKAKSQAVFGTGVGGRCDLPGEHGFRFYPRFYRHVIRSMDEIPDSLSPTGFVSGNLVGTTQTGVALGDDGGLIVGPRHPKDLLGSLDVLRRSGVSPVDVWRYLAVHIKYLTSCEERRLAEFEPMSWLDFIKADDPERYSARYRDIIVSVTRTMVAMDARRGSARTVGNASALLLLDPAYSRGDDLDRTMTGPTSDVWLEPWREHLESAGVRFHFGHALHALHADAKRLRGASVRTNDGESLEVDADEYVLAVPIEVAHRLLTPTVAALDPGLAALAGSNLDELTAWMVGAQYFLRRDVPLCDGHVFYPFSPWALTAISQAQFWNRGARGMTEYGDGSLRGILSIDVSDCFATDARGRALAQCTDRNVALDAIWEQILDGVGEPERRAFADNVFARHLDENVTFGPDGAKNAGRLLVHPPGSFAVRPRADIAADNCSIAADYVATGVDLASMEGANEAGRLAARAILGRAGIDPASVELFEYPTQTTFARARALDRVLFRARLPHPMDGADSWTDGIGGRLLGAAMSLREAELVRALIDRVPHPTREAWRSAETVNAFLRWFDSLPGRQDKGDRVSVPPPPRDD